MAATTTNTQDDDDKTIIKPSYTDHSGYLMPKGFPVDGFISSLTYEAQENDLFVATYPKVSAWIELNLHVMFLETTKIKPAVVVGMTCFVCIQYCVNDVKECPLY